jgi:NitT/TauT family transport system permease protein
MADNQQDGKARQGAELGALPEIRVVRPHFLRVRERITPVWRWSLAVIPLAVFLVWWLWVTAGAEPELRRMSPTILPSPSEVIGRLPSLWFDDALMRNILLSLARVLGGFAVAVVIGVPLGILMASFSRIGATFSLVATLLSYLPIPAIVPLTMAWWKTGEEQKVGFLALATFAYLLPMVVRIVGQVDHKYLLSAYAQGATAWQSVNRVLVPIAMPDILNAMRLCLGVGWTYIVLAEVIRAGEGLGGVGNLIMVFQRRGHMEEVYLTVVAIMLVGAILDRGCAWLSAQLFPYRATLGEQ